MTRLEHELWAIDGLLGKVTKGKPKATAPASVAEAFELTDPAQAAKAKDTVSGRPPPFVLPQTSRVRFARDALARALVPSDAASDAMHARLSNPHAARRRRREENGARSLFAFFDAPIVRRRRV